MGQELASPGARLTVFQLGCYFVTQNSWGPGPSGEDGLEKWSSSPDTGRDSLLQASEVLPVGSPWLAADGACPGVRLGLSWCLATECLHGELSCPALAGPSLGQVQARAQLENELLQLLPFRSAAAQSGRRVARSVPELPSLRHARALRFSFPKADQGLQGAYSRTVRRRWWCRVAAISEVTPAAPFLQFSKCPALSCWTLPQSACPCSRSASCEPHRPGGPARNGTSALPC